MSKAFTREDDGDAAPVVAPRAPLPDGTPNYVTARGLELLTAELADLDRALAETERGTPAFAAAAVRRAELAQRIATAERPPPPDDPTTVSFGATVTLRERDQLHRYTIVGVDEADAAQERIAFVSPLARALLGRAAGDAVRLRAPRGDRELEIVAISYDAD